MFLQVLAVNTVFTKNLCLAATSVCIRLVVCNPHGRISDQSPIYHPKADDESETPTLVGQASMLHHFRSSYLILINFPLRQLLSEPRVSKIASGSLAQE